MEIFSSFVFLIFPEELAQDSTTSISTILRDGFKTLVPLYMYTVVPRIGATFLTNKTLNFTFTMIGMIQLEAFLWSHCWGETRVTGENLLV